MLDKFPVLNGIGHYLHKIMWIFAAAGTFLSCFHQGSLGGTYGVLYAKAGWHRYHHQLFFLAIISAMAAGPSLTILFTKIAEKVRKKQVIPDKTYYEMARISGFMFIIYFTLRIFDIYQMATVYYGLWTLAIELILCFIPVILLNLKKFREQEKLLLTGTSCAVIGMVWNRFNLTVHGGSVPNFPWNDFMGYMPSIAEWLITIGGFATLILCYMWAAKYLPIFSDYNGGGHSPEAEPEA